MRIAVNTRTLIPGRAGGIERFTCETLKRITVRHPEHSFIFIFDRPYADEFLFSSNITPAVSIPFRHPVLWYLWGEYAVPRILKKYKADIFFSPDGFLSLSARIPSVAAIHDLSFYHYPDDLPKPHSLFYNYFFPRYAKKAVSIATVSNRSKDDIVRVYCQPPNKIDVVYNGVGNEFQPLDEAEKKNVREELTGGRPYFLYVGALHPRKNIVRLLQAFDRFKAATGSPTALVLAGPKLFKTGKIFSVYAQTAHKADVVFMGSISGRQLVRIYGAARALTYLPYYEGFGLPTIEAMACDIPVITADRTAIPEVCGEAALLVDPFCIDAIAGAMQAVDGDPALRSKLIEKGRVRCLQFSWDKTAALLWNCIERAWMPGND